MDRRKATSKRLTAERKLDRMRSSGRIRTVSPTPRDAEAPDPFHALIPSNLGALPELEELREEVHALRRLHEVIHFLGGAPDREALEAEVLDLGLRVSGLTRGLLALRVRSDDDAPRFKVEQARGFDDQARSAAETKVLRKILGHVLDRRETILEGAILEAGGILGFAKGADLALGAVAALPLEVGGTVLGGLILDDPERRVPFSQAEQRLLRSFARHAGQALARIEERSRLGRKVGRLQRRAERLEAERDAARTRLDRRQAPGGAPPAEERRGPDPLDLLLSTPFRDAKASFVERYLREALRRANGDVRIASQAKGLPLARLLGLMQHLEVGPERSEQEGRGSDPAGRGTWGGGARQPG